MDVSHAPLAISTPARPSATAARWWIWGLPLAFLVHDGEEALVAVRGHGIHLGTPFALTTSQAIAAMLFELAWLWAVAVVAVWSARPGWAMRTFAVFLAAWLLHGVGHLLDGALLTRGYAFGVATALPACVGYGILAFVRLRADGLLGRRDIGIAFAVALPAVAPLILLAQGFGRLVG